jgi:hypothetical protein
MSRLGRPSGVLSLALAGLLPFAFWGCCSASPRNHLILLGSAAEIVKPEKKTVLSKSAGNEMAWKAPTGNGVTVTFETPCSAAKPFENMNCSNDKWQISCPSRCQVCPSGPINPALEPPDAGLYFAYALALVPADGGSDPGIIIKR